MDQNVIIVLGMHRSGTSMLTGCLEEAGLYLGDTSNKFNPHNAKGQKEQIFLMELHEEVLRANGGSWDLPPYTYKWKFLHNKTRQLFIKSMSDYPIWGFKDPRVLFLLDKWKLDIPNANFVGIFRHPLKVANSLYKRNKMSFNQGLDLWLKYNRRLWFYYKKYKFPMIEFVDDQAVVKKNVLKLIDHLHLDTNAELKFLDQSLMSVEYPDMNLPIEIKKLYRSLQELGLK